MSVGVSNYECICGGNITESWDNNSLSVICDRNCVTPYPMGLYEDIQKHIKEGKEYIYRGIKYYHCGDMYYVNVIENNGKEIYESFSSEEAVKKTIDDSSIQIIL